MVTRRHILALIAALAATGVQAQSTADLAEAGPLGDVALGTAEAKVTIIEYASLTCGHCAAFHKNTFPSLKERYIDTGKVRYILREFPLDPLATAGFMLARCEEGKFYPVSDLLFEQQRNWAFVDRPVDALQKIVRQAGITSEKFEACLRDDRLLQGINAVKNRASEKFGVNSTPTFFINGQTFRGAMTLEEMEKAIKPLLGE